MADTASTTLGFGIRGSLATPLATGNWQLTTLLAILLLAATIHAQAIGTGTAGVDMNMDPTIEKAPLALPTLSGERRFISLRNLSRLAAEAQGARSELRPEVATLGGIGRLEGWIVDAENNDILLVGRHDPRWPALHLDDLAINLRNVWGRQPAPFCSLEPSEENLAKVRQVIAQAGNQLTEAQMRQFTQRLREALGPQRVILGGVPEDSLHAHAMIDADYHMKKVSLGLAKAAGIPSQLDRMIDAANADIKAGNLPQPRGASLSRFYFHAAPGDPLFLQGENIVHLRRLRVIVMTEKQWAAAEGKPAAGQREPLAEAFAADFSRGFDRAARVVPEYARLDNLFRLQAVLRAMHHLRAVDEAKLDLRFLLEEYRPAAAKPMPDSLPGLVGDRFTRVPAGGEILVLHPLVAGGVTMQMPMQPAQFDRTRPAADLVNPLRPAALTGRPNPNALWWPEPPGPRK